MPRRPGQRSPCRGRTAPGLEELEDRTVLSGGLLSSALATPAILPAQLPATLSIPVVSAPPSVTAPASAAIPPPGAVATPTPAVALPSLDGAATVALAPAARPASSTATPTPVLSLTASVGISSPTTSSVPTLGAALSVAASVPNVAQPSGPIDPSLSAAVTIAAPLAPSSGLAVNVQAALPTSTGGSGLTVGTSLDVSAGSGSVLDVQAGLTTSVGGSHGPDVGFSARAAFGGSIVFSVGAGAVASLGSSQGLEPNSLGTSSAGIDPAISHPKGTIASGLQIAAPVVPGRTARTSSLLDGPLSGPPTTDSGTGNSEISSPLWLGGAGAQQPPVVQLPADSPTRPVIPGGQVQATSSAADANANTPTQEQAPNAVSAPPLVPLTPTILVTFLPPVTELGQQAQATVAEDE